MISQKNSVFFFVFSALTIIFSVANSNEIEPIISKKKASGIATPSQKSNFSEKILVKKKLEEGLSEKQIYNFLENKYGNWILYDPKFNKNTYFLWLFPLFLFILGGVVIFKLFIIKKN